MVENCSPSTHYPNMDSQKKCKVLETVRVELPMNRK